MNKLKRTTISGEFTSPNHYAGNGKFSPAGVVIHTTEGSFLSTKSWFQSRRSKVSSHFVVRRNGEVHSCISLRDPAWHAGAKVNPDIEWIRNIDDPNWHLWGIEFVALEGQKHTAKQLISGCKLIADLSDFGKWDINSNSVIFHNQIKKTKRCPEPTFHPSIWRGVSRMLQVWL